MLEWMMLTTNLMSFFIYINTTWLFVIIKERHPRELHVEEDVVVQVHVQEHGANIEDQVNDPMEEDVDDNNTIEEHGTNIFI